MRVTISGMPGSGRSLIAALLGEKYNVKCIQIGQMRRKMAQELGISLEELNELGETQAFTDEDVDKVTRELAKEHQDIIFEGRVAFHFVPDSIKIFLDVSIDVGAQRLFQGNPWENEYCATLEEVKDMVKKQITSDRERYKKYYDVDYIDKSQYDIVINTTNKSISEVMSEIERAIKAQSL